MHRAILEACLPWLGLLAAAGIALVLLTRLAGARMQLGRLAEIHRNEEGAAQTLSFVLTLPFFMMIMLLVVQLVQLMMGTVVVHYAAFSAARAAVVWIPARTADPLEPENCISTLSLESGVAPDAGESEGGVTYKITVDQNSPKVRKIFSAAVLACMPISPSASVPSTPLPFSIDSGRLTSTYLGAARNLSGNPKSPERLLNKLNYAAGHTRLEIKAYHQNENPDASLVDFSNDPYVPWPRRTWQGGIAGYTFYWRPFGEFKTNELGWQDSITVIVSHDMALFGTDWVLKGLSAMASSTAAHVFGPISVQKWQDTLGTTHTITLCTVTAQATLGLEGEKCVVPYAY